jgi:hypothetical protein
LIICYSNCNKLCYVHFSQFEYVDPLRQAGDLLNDSRLQEGFYLKPSVVGAGDNRKYGNLFLGDWANRTAAGLASVSNKICYVWCNDFYGVIQM